MTNRQHSGIRLAAAALSWLLLALGIGAETAAAATAQQDGAKRSNRDLYLEGTGGAGGAAAGSPESVKPTVKFWVERDSSQAGRKRDIIVEENEAFKTGDKVWFKFVTNVDCYAYLVNKGSSGKLAMLFPGLAGPNNQVQARQEKTMPSEGRPFVFDQQTGNEELCLVIAPQPIPEFEQIAQETRGQARAVELDRKQNELWQKGLQRCAGVGQSRDLTLEVDPNTSGGETPGAYVTDHGAGGFDQPIKVYRTLRHE